MTKEQAIDIIKCLAWHGRPEEEKIEEAIKALEQQPSECEIQKEKSLAFLDGCITGIKANSKIACDDCVSRQAVIDSIDSISKHHGGISDIRLVATQLSPVAPTFPKGATNGDVFKLVFSNAERKHDVTFGGWMESNWIECDGEDITHDEWWNAPYKN